MGLTGVVLCGGKSSRMGIDKAVIEIDGTPLVELVAARVARIADPVLLASGAAPRFERLPYREVADPVPDAGPLTGLAAALTASPHELVAAAAVDMPFVSPEVFRLLLELRAGEEAVVPVTDDGPQPLHAIYHRDVAPKMVEAVRQSRLGLRAFLRDLDVREVGPDEWRGVDPEGDFALNVNSAAELDRLRARASRPSPPGGVDTRSATDSD